MSEMIGGWVAGLTATLIREGINKHRAREIAQGYWEAYCKDDAETEAYIERLREANEKFGRRQEWWNEKMFALETEAELLRADAERYRWLRDSQAEMYGDEYGFTFVYECQFDDFKSPKRGLDAAIDAARGES